ncbi:MAG: hypothetical protein BGO41_00865 [Clostridiales bacterium 38-18]|nr:MAG: hypothetical protein BGO41_00865 [Clostridiales bacterium 38-18]
METLKRITTNSEFEVHMIINTLITVFMISFLVESIIAQPIARKIMEVYHIRIESKVSKK